ncbi:MAG: MucR family transcriptional regulator [Pseudomonadota bacterium]
MVDKAKADAPLSLTASIVAAYAGHNQLPRDELPVLIRSVFGTLTSLETGVPEPEEAEESAPGPLIPAVPIDQSVTKDAIICLEDGKSFKTLKRHLNAAYGMTPDQYRERWGLSKDYPMVAPSYSKKRAATAKKIGLGRKRK